NGLRCNGQGGSQGPPERETYAREPYIFKNRGTHHHARLRCQRTAARMAVPCTVRPGLDNAVPHTEAGTARSRGGTRDASASTAVATGSASQPESTRQARCVLDRAAHSRQRASSATARYVHQVTAACPGQPTNGWNRSAVVTKG